MCVYGCYNPRMREDFVIRCHRNSEDDGRLSGTKHTRMRRALKKMLREFGITVDDIEPVKSPCESLERKLQNSNDFAPLT